MDYLFTLITFKVKPVISLIIIKSVIKNNTFLISKKQRYVYKQIFRIKPLYSPYLHTELMGKEYIIYSPRAQNGKMSGSGSGSSVPRVGKDENTPSSPTLGTNEPYINVEILEF